MPLRATLSQRMAGYARRLRQIITPMYITTLTSRICDGRNKTGVQDLSIMDDSIYLDVSYNVALSVAHILTR
jgi:hypothetical protein